MSEPKTRQRGRAGRGQPHADNEKTREGRTKKWPSGLVMPTANAQANQDRQKTIIEATEEYLGPPPKDEILFEVTLVIPGKHMLLPEPLDPAYLDACRKGHEVWIVQENPKIIHILSRTLPDLKEAFREINWAIHDIRTAQHHTSSLFLVQPPMGGECLITVDLDCRPHAPPWTCSQQLIPVQNNSYIANGLVQELKASFASSTDALQGRPEQSLQMRVDFGHVKIRRRKKITQQENGKANEMHYAEFAKMTSQYGLRGGADFEEKLQGPRLASNIIRHLMQPSTEFFHSHQSLNFHNTISIRLQDNNLEANIERMSSASAALANVLFIKPDHWPPLKWTILAPDRKYDWCFRVDSGTNLPISPQISRLVDSIVVSCDTQETSWSAFLQNPVEIKIKNPQLLKGKVDQILLKSTVAIPFRDTPYAMNVSLHRLWQGLDTQASPYQSWQSLGFHGIHWAAEINSVNATGTRKDWGAHQRHVWRGSAETAEGQFEEFVSYVLEGLSALDGL